MTGQSTIEDVQARIEQMEARAAETAERRRACEDQAATQLGELVRQMRIERGMGTPRLAERAVATRTGIRRLEAGTLRPQLSLLRAIANALDPDHRHEITDQLVAVAAPILVPEVPAGRMYRVRRLTAGQLAGRVPWPSPEARSMRLRYAAAAMYAAGHALGERFNHIDEALAPFDSVDVSSLGHRECLLLIELDELAALSGELSAESWRLSADAGGNGDAVRPLRRWRGDPPDVSPDAPPLDDLRALSRWVWEWQVREARRVPSTARERAIAATGERERAAVRDIPEREKIVYHTEDSGTLPHHIET